MTPQLDRLIEVSRLPNVTIQVIPYEAGAHPAPDTNFSILEFNGSAPDMVYTEGLFGWIFLEQPGDVERYHRVFEILRTAALNEEDSIAFIAKMARDLRGGS